MSGKRLVLRPIAFADIDRIIAYYLLEANDDVAMGFADALERGLDHVAHMPSSGSLRYAAAVETEGLRHWPLTHYPFLVFYLEQNDHIDVWRVLHATRDMPASLQERDLQ